VNGRERILVALEGGEPDRVPCALGFYHVACAAPEHAAVVDVAFVDVPPSPEDEARRARVEPHSPDTRLGSRIQIANYTRWQYRPLEKEHANPLARARTLDELRRFPFPEPALDRRALATLERRVRGLHEQGVAVAGNLPHLGGELFETAWRLRGLENFLLDLACRPDWADCLLDRLTARAGHHAETHARAGVDVLVLDDDVGMPGGMMIGPATWRRFFRPRLASIIDRARRVSPALAVLYHSDGDYAPIVGDLVEIGVDAINPLQPEYMDPAAIRQRHGTRPALWGTVGRHTTFSFAAPEDIDREVKARIDTLGRAGLVLSPAYDIDEPDVPPANVAAFLNAVEKHGRRRQRGAPPELG